MRKWTEEMKALQRARREGLIDRTVPTAGAARAARTNLGLELMAFHAVPGARYSYDEIAAWAGCTESAIHWIARKALRKLRVKLMFHKDPVLREMAEAFGKSCQ